MRKPSVHSRKTPQQARSTGLVAAVLEAGGRVLAKEGAQRFTMARVAETAGVSVGSIYQYFPNKAAILFRLQSEEWRRTVELLRAILETASDTPALRVRRLAHAFVASEVEEALLRGALNDAAPLYRDAPEATEAWAAASHTMLVFLNEAIPHAPAETRGTAAEIMTATLGEVGRRISEIASTPAEIARYSESLADMLCAYLEHLRARKEP